MRRPYFQVFGSIRFGGTIKVEDAWELGFDHLALAVGAGLPKELNIPNSLAPGMRQANDFLMSLQLTGAAKTSSFSQFTGALAGSCHRWWINRSRYGHGSTSVLYCSG